MKRLLFWLGTLFIPYITVFVVWAKKMFGKTGRIVYTAWAVVAAISVVVSMTSGGHSAVSSPSTKQIVASGNVKNTTAKSVKNTTKKSVDHSTHYIAEVKAFATKLSDNAKDADETFKVASQDISGLSNGKTSTLTAYNALKTAASQASNASFKINTMVIPSDLPSNVKDDLSSAQGHAGTAYYVEQQGAKAIMKYLNSPQVAELSKGTQDFKDAKTYQNQALSYVLKAELDAKNSK